MDIMPFIFSFIPILFCCIAGLLYGASFLLQHRGLFSYSSPQNNWATKVAFFILRVAILFYVGKYLLQRPLIPSILGSMGFIAMFWLIILQAKARFHERT